MDDLRERRRAAGVKFISNAAAHDSKILSHFSSVFPLEYNTAVGIHWVEFFPSLKLQEPDAKNSRLQELFAQSWKNSYTLFVRFISLSVCIVPLEKL